MGLIKTFADTYYTYRILKILSAKWENTDAYKVGIIDSNGNKIVDELSRDQERSYRSFDRIVYNLKRVMSKVPFSQNPFVRFGTAIALLKENDLTDDELDDIVANIEEEVPVNNSGDGKVAYNDTPLKKKKMLTRLEDIE